MQRQLADETSTQSELAEKALQRIQYNIAKVSWQ